MKQRVLITGGNKGIGLEVTRLFVNAGWRVCVVARNFKGFEFLKHQNVQAVEFDLANIEAIPDLVADLGFFDVLVNNAGVMYSLPYNAYPQAKVDSMLCINLQAPVALIREVSKAMVEQSKGRIVNNASIAGQIGHPDVWYGISKAGLINATKAFSKILGPKGIVVNAVAPGPVETDMLNVIPDERKTQIKNSVISGRFARPEEVAKAIFWLATTCPEYINGTCVDVNNGFFPR